MAAIYNNEINKYTDWGGDSSTGGKPVSGKRVQQFIKGSLQKKIGYIYESSNGYYGFADEEDYKLYKKTQDQNLIIQQWGKQKNTLYTGNTPPDDKEALWVDTNNNYYGSDATIYSIQKAINALQQQLDVLMGLRVQGVISGTVEDSARTSMIKASTPQIPSIVLEQLQEQLDSGEITYEEYNERLQELTDTGDGIKPNYSEGNEPTVNHISIKMGTWDQLNGNKRNFINGELLWCTDKTKLYIYNNGILYAVGGSGSTNDDSTMNEQQINDLIDSKLESVEQIGFIPVGSDSAKYIAKVNNEGKLVVYDNSLDDYPESPSTNYYYSGTVSNEGLVINSFYLGGNSNDEHSYQPCSHNFVEIANVWMDGKANTKDISLNGLYLLYFGENVSKWQILPLWGKIPAGGTFLIRGAQCSVMDSNTTKLKIKNYDMEWNISSTDSSTGEIVQSPIKFSQDNAVFYLCWGTKDQKFYELNSDTPTDNLSTTLQLMDSSNSTCAKGYIDLASFNNEKICEKSTYVLPTGKKAKDVLFRRWYMLDPVTQSNPKDGISKHNNRKYLSATYLTGANVGENCSIEEFTPKTSYENKTIGNTRSLFLENEPNTITCTFGIQATDNTNSTDGVKGSNGKGIGATRGFCWNSVGYFDEYLMFKKQSDTEWKKVESIKENITAESYRSQLLEQGVTIPLCINNDYKQYYERIRWETSYGQSVTTHKVLISGLTSGKYEYKIVRDNGIAYKDGYNVSDESYTYTSKIRTFTVHSDSEVTSFNFVQTTDQQGANWEEYELWNLSARVIAREHDKWVNGYTETKSDGSTEYHQPQTVGIPNFNFTINTGDICYNGSRSNEWIDYYRGYEPLADKEEMLTVGNNDLAPISMRDIGNGKESPWKINVGVIDYFYAVEIDTRNPCIFSGKSAINESQTVQYKIPSLYSFNYGKFHFVSLLSEIRTISNKTSYGTTDDSGKLIDPENTSAKDSNIEQSTVNAIFGIKDSLRGDGSNKNASAIYDVEEEWIIKDLLLWKGQEIPNNFDRNEQRYNSTLVNNCEKCIFFIHEMPFNIISQSSYDNYEQGAVVPRETAKAYLNRYHNYEYQRLFKLWGIRMAIGGHKHTAALTGPVYDAPPGYNPITKQINNISDHNSDDILNDSAINSSGVFDPQSSFRPFMQVTVQDFNSNWDTYRNYTKEVYNNSSQSLTFIGETSNITLASKSYNDSVRTSIMYPKLRLEVVDTITAPSYVMCQATGFKNKSNSDLAADIIPWERFFVKGSGDSIKGQCYPFFTLYKLDNSSITVSMYRIGGFYEPSDKAGYWDLTKIYNRFDSLEENRKYYTENSRIELFNDSSDEGTKINLTK